MPNGNCKHPNLDKCATEHIYSSRLASFFSITGSLIVFILLSSSKLIFSIDPFINIYALCFFAANILYYFVTVHYVEDRLIETLNGLKRNGRGKARVIEWCIRVIMLILIYGFFISSSLIPNIKMFFILFIIMMNMGYFLWDFLVRKVMSSSGTFWHNFTRTDISTSVGSLLLVFALLIPFRSTVKVFVIVWSCFFYIGAFLYFFLGNKKEGYIWFIESHKRLG